MTAERPQLRAGGGEPSREPRRDERAVAAERAPPPSPCVNICAMDACTGWCAGCWRTLEEIAAWCDYSDTEKRAVWERIRARQAGTASGHGEHARPSPLHDSPAAPGKA